MALQDLTPQLRTRLSKVERAVGLFVTFATLLLAGGFVYYIYHTAERKGWFKTKMPYATSLQNAAGLKTGDPVKLMGFTIGEITRIEAEPPNAYYGVTIYFQVMQPYYGYIWLDSKVRVAPADFLGNRNLEILKGSFMAPTVMTPTPETLLMLNTDLVNEKFRATVKKIRAEAPGYSEHAARVDATNELNLLLQKMDSTYYAPPKTLKAYWIEPLESPALTERLETMVSRLESGLPGILALTNKIAAVLDSANAATTNLHHLLSETRPVLTNAAVITENLRNPDGSLGKWLLDTNLLATLDALQLTLKTADETLLTARQMVGQQDTNLTGIASNLNLSLESLAGITSNLHAQVQSNPNLVKAVADAIVHTDEMVQGLKRHWLLRSAFKTNQTEKVDKKKSVPAAPRFHR